jgi:hypothetical protein
MRRLKEAVMKAEATFKGQRIIAVIPDIPFNSQAIAALITLQRHAPNMDITVFVAEQIFKAKLHQINLDFQTLLALNPGA